MEDCLPCISLATLISGVKPTLQYKKHCPLISIIVNFFELGKYCTDFPCNYVELFPKMQVVLLLGTH